MYSVEPLSFDCYRGKVTQFGIPSHHIVLGSGFGNALQSLSQLGWIERGRIAFNEIQGMLAASVPDHAGQFIFLEHKQSKHLIQIQAGRLHGYEGIQPRQVVMPVLLSRCYGVDKFILTNAAGGLDLKMKPGDAMVISDQVNLTGQNPLIGENPKHPNGHDMGPRFPDMGFLFESSWRNSLSHELKKHPFSVHEGIYLGLMGPTFETHAEVQLFSKWGMGAVGMSTVWESIVLKHSGARLAGISLISNLGAGLSSQKLQHESIVETCRGSAAGILQAIVSSISGGNLE